MSTGPRSCPMQIHVLRHSNRKVPVPDRSQNRNLGSRYHGTGSLRVSLYILYGANKVTQKLKNVRLLQTLCMESDLLRSALYLAVCARHFYGSRFVMSCYACTI